MGAHRAIKLSNDNSYRKLYNLTLSGWIDLGFTELSSGNDTFTDINIDVYPDGINKTIVHAETNDTGENTPL